MRAPKAASVSYESTRTTSENYDSMPYGYRWFRQSELVRKCTISNAYFAVMSAGFVTELQGLEPDDDLTQYEELKRKIDEVNKRVNLDLTLFTAQVKRSIYGKTGFEIMLDSVDDLPGELYPLESTKLKPQLLKKWKLIGFKYKGKDDFYKPEEVLYFVNLGLEADREGFSDVEPIRDVCNSRHELLGENFSEIVRTLWAPIAVYQVDTSGLSDENAAKKLKELLPALKSGKSVAVTETVDVTLVNMSPDLQGLVALLEQLKQAIIANYGTPRFLLGEPIENRATAYAEFEAYIQGPIGHIQRYFKREIERNWYDPMTRKILGLADEIPLPVRVKHNWNVIRISDIFEMAKAVAVLYARGDGIIGEIPEVGYDMLNLSRRDVEGLLEKRRLELEPEKKLDEED
ncbi:MAG: phage portal protein [Candidatus Bathyarchaeota archaeon]|nr:phage portal protein [Candidatus Bathyarchaeota archaeon]